MASERYLVLEFGFNLNKWCSGVVTRQKGVPTPLFLALHPWACHAHSQSKMRYTVVFKE